MPNGDRTEEVIVSQQTLNRSASAVSLRGDGLPRCAAPPAPFFQEMADQIQTYLREQIRSGRPAIGRESMKVA